MSNTGDRNRFDKLTERARRVLSLAHEEALSLQHNYIGTEHLLLGLLREGDGAAAKILTHLGLDIQQLREATVALVGRGDRIILGEIHFTAHAKQAITLAVNRVHDRGYHYIGTEHILLGLTLVPESKAAQLLESLGVSLNNVRIQAVQALRQTQSSTIPGQAGSAQPVRAYDEPASTTGGSFNKFTEQARQVISYAQEEALHLQNNYIGTEHLLLGLTRDSESVVGTVLGNLGVQLSQVRSAVEFIIGSGDRIVLGEIGFTPRAKQVIELAADEARRLNNDYIGTEHLLLGLIREGQGIAAGVLESLGVTLEKVRTQTILVLSQLAEETQEEQPSATRGPTQQVIIERQGIQSFRGHPFTQQSYRVLDLAKEEAQRFQHNYIGTEHLLLGLVRQGEGVAGAVLQNLGVQLSQVRNAVEFIIGRGDRIVLGEIGLTPRAKQVIDLAADEARKLNNDYIGTEHLLLGLVREGQGIATGVLESLGVRLPKVRTETMRVLERATDEEP